MYFCFVYATTNSVTEDYSIVRHKRIKRKIIDENNIYILKYMIGMYENNKENSNVHLSSHQERYQY